LKQELISLIHEIQFAIAHLGSLNKSLEALRYVEYFSFSLANRLLCIESMRIQSSRNVFGINGMVIRGLYDFNTCFSLVLLTHPKNIKTSADLEVKHVEMLKEDTSTMRTLRIYNTVDLVLQLQMLTFLDPLIDAILPEHFYGFRRGRSSLQAIAYLSSSIQLSDASKYYLVFVNIWKCFDSISHEFIQDRFPFPMSYKDLLVRWIKCCRVLKSGKKIKMRSGVSRGSALGPLICNFALACLTSNFFKDSFFSKNFNGKIRFLICYDDDLIVKVINQNEGYYTLKKLTSRLSEASLDINSEKTRMYDLSTKTKFD
jgi:retron-type reverse transcriptase